MTVESVRVAISGLIKFYGRGIDMKSQHILMFFLIVLGAIAGSTLATITYIGNRQIGLNDKKVSRQASENNALPTSLNLEKKEVMVNQNKSSLKNINPLSSKIDFSQFRKSFLSAVKRRDESFIHALVTPQAQASFGHNINLDNYNLDDSNSSFWQQIEKAVSMGCTLEINTRLLEQETGNEVWVCPKTYGRPIYSFDWQDQVSILAEKVYLRAQPKSNAPIVEILSKELVKFDSETYNKLSEVQKQSVNKVDGWTPIILKKGKRGWVENHFVYYEPRDFKVSFARFDGQWRLRYLYPENSN